MKLRSQTYREMVKILKDAGVYVEGMQTSELKQLLQTVEMSTMERIEANQENQNFESAHNEGELEVNSSHPVEVHQSTTDMLPSVLTPRFSLAPMAGDVGVNISQPGCDSPSSEPLLLSPRFSLSPIASDLGVDLSQPDCDSSSSEPLLLTPRFSLSPTAGDVGVDVSQPDCDSPPSEPLLLIVRAVVHHALEWSPSAERQTVRERRTVRERSADGNSRVLRSHSRRVQTNNKNNT
ncbi:uncharacterized protein [Drosophila pseudoobscura]|uniref:Uncharacterized protein isoform X2 n=1 Tax=Drosophila pseudoobscura pseudoobscura TaxID=46245 RepID=A0A6I8UZ67_DROPS|nr:uncharacterized protein LOC6901192 isoform X2 [Drosophila pseudoobscura]